MIPHRRNIPRYRLRACVALSLLFLILYPLTNYLTSLRTAVPSLHFAWEGRIPFIPLFILPYMSIDLFFLAAFFLARNRRDCQLLTQRLAFAILIASLIFLLLPLKFGFDRPPLDGPLGALFNNFRSLDPPFNQCPSLHIALGLILLDFYCRHTKGVLRIFLITWFTLILLSPLFTYQHHFIDILGGALLAIFLLHIFTPKRPPASFTTNPRLAFRYAAAAFLLFVAALLTVALPLLVPALLLYLALSLAGITNAYHRHGPRIFRKHKGILPWTTYLLYAPFLLGQHLSLFYYARQSAPYNRLTPALIVGRRLTSRQARRLLATENISAVLDLTAEFTECKPLRTLPYLNLQILDLTAPTPQHFQQALIFLATHTHHGTVYLHCKIGYSRTATIAAAHLLKTRQAQNIQEALTQLQHARPAILLRPEALTALNNFAANLPRPMRIPSLIPLNHLTT